jgi:hypothetical protein
VAFDFVTLQPAKMPRVCLASTGVNVQIPGPLATLPRLQDEADVLVICYDSEPPNDWPPNGMASRWLPRRVALSSERRSIGV